MCFVPAIANNSDFLFRVLGMRLQQGYFFTTIFKQRIKQKKRIFLSWNFNERQRSTNDTNLAGYFSQRFFLQRIKQKRIF